MRVTSVTSMLSAALGSIGATSALRPERCEVSSDIERGAVEVLADRHGVRDRVRREELQRDGDVAEGEVEVEQRHRALAGVGDGRGEVGRERGLAAAALGREDGDDPAG